MFLILIVGNPNCITQILNLQSKCFFSIIAFFSVHFLSINERKWSFEGEFDVLLERFGEQNTPTGNRE
jgi:hypothetical protein